MILTFGMAHQRKLIRKSVVALLVSGGTAAGARVKSTRVEPHKKSQLPAIAVYTLKEPVDPASKDTAPRELTRDLKLEVVGWVGVTDPDTVDDAMDDLAEQIEAAMEANRWLVAAKAITAVDPATDQITIPGHGLATGAAPVFLISTGGLVPAGATLGRQYHAIVVDDNTINLATSETNALAGTAVDLTDAGSGVLELLVATAAESILEDTEMEVVAIDGRSDPLVGIVTLTYSITYRTSPAFDQNLADFVTVYAEHRIVGAAADNEAQDLFTVEEP